MSRLFPFLKGSDFVSEKRKDSKGRVLKTGEGQRKDWLYQYRYKDIAGEPFMLVISRNSDKKNWSNPSRKV